MIEQDLRFTVEYILTLVEHHNGQKVDQLHRCLLLGINLCFLNRHQLVANILHDLKSNSNLEHVLNHNIIMGFN